MGREARPALVIVTDLDGTLLDEGTYALGPASAVVERVVQAGIPLVLCSSKTRAEIEALMAELGIDQPFIAENGGAVFMPPTRTTGSGGHGLRSAGRTCVGLGLPYDEVVSLVRAAAGRHGVRVRGFADMSIADVAVECRLTPLQAQLAKMREFDEPFRLTDASPGARQRFVRTLRQADVRVVEGGRYCHAIGGTDKGRAVKALKTTIATTSVPILVGLGDAPNDISFLREVDVPVIVRNPGVDTTRLVAEVPGAMVTEQPGPAGWAVAVSRIVDHWEAGRLRP